MLQLQLDEGKTYSWSTAASQRQLLRAAGLRVVNSQRELCGILAFTPSMRNRALLECCDASKPLFAALRRSAAPYGDKLRVLPTKFWSMALHGAEGCMPPDHVFASLRSQAVKALSAHGAGVNSLLRLSLFDGLEAGPGYYVFWRCLIMIRRLCIRSDELLPLWGRFMQQYTGSLYQGPFSTLLGVFSRVSWCVLSPPFFRDEEGLIHDRLHMPRELLRMIATRAWLNSVATQVSHRDGFAGLIGIDPSLARLDAPKCTPTEQARVSALQSGALLFDHLHAKFDFAITGLCECCGVADTHEHRICHCRGAASAFCVGLSTLARAPVVRHSSFASTSQPAQSSVARSFARTA